MTVQKWDIQIVLACSKKHSRWSFEIIGHPVFGKFGCGFLFSGSKHSLLAMALTSALKTPSRTTIAKYLIRTGECIDLTDAIKHGRKLRILVKTENGSFLRAAKVHKPTLAAQALDAEMRKELARFEVDWQLVDETQVAGPFDWGERQLWSARIADGFAAPMAIRSH